MLVINGLLLLITESLAGERLIIDGGIMTAIWGGLVMGLVSMALESLLQLNDDEEDAQPPGVVIIREKQKLD